MTRAWPSVVAAQLLVAAVSVLATSTVRAQPPDLEVDLGGPNDYGNFCLSPNDDGSSNRIDITSAFPAGLRFFTTTHTAMYVNTNGNITFAGALGTYTPRAFPIASQPMIAPYWADVDIRGASCSGFGGGLWPTCMLAPGAINGVYWSLRPGRIVVTWDQTGYFSCRDELQMTFQLIISEPEEDTCSAGDFDVEFRYTECGWNTGNASGGTAGFPSLMTPPRACTTAADCGFGNVICDGGQCYNGVPGQAGFDAGNGMDFVEIEGSRTRDIHTILCNESNIGRPGVWQFQIRGGAVICPDAGEVCDTTRPGVCREGRTQCVGMGTECRPLIEESAERCDALDNDCDGMVDEGDTICGSTTAVCDMGMCVDTCFEGGCNEGFECDMRGRCVEVGCADVMCERGERCSRGVCGDACAGIVCPAGQSCRSGRCLDLCEGLTCDDCTVCESGACVERCSATSCAVGESCGADGRCIETTCMGVSCPAGQYCAAGSCRDACDGVACPAGEECVTGECRPRVVEVDAGMPDSGTPEEDAGMPMEVDAGVDSGPPAMDAGPPCRGPACEEPVGRRGCSCSVPGSTDQGGAPLAILSVLALGLALVSRRRR